MRRLSVVCCGRESVSHPSRVQSLSLHAENQPRHAMQPCTRRPDGQLIFCLPRYSTAPATNFIAFLSSAQSMVVVACGQNCVINRHTAHARDAA